MVLSLPTSSNREFSRYIKRLLSRGKKSDSVVTKFSLKKAVNKTGISYSQVQFSVARELDTKEIELIKNYSEQVKSYAQSKDNFQKVDITTGEIIDSEESV